MSFNFMATVTNRTCAEHWDPVYSKVLNYPFGLTLTGLNDAHHKIYSAAPAPPAPINRKKESKLKFLNRLLIWQSMVVTEILSPDGEKNKLARSWSRQPLS